jgi:hypothetical protein
MQATIYLVAFVRQISVGMVIGRNDKDFYAAKHGSHSCSDHITTSLDDCMDSYFFDCFYDSVLKSLIVQALGMVTSVLQAQQGLNI